MFFIVHLLRTQLGFLHWRGRRFQCAFLQVVMLLNFVACPTTIVIDGVERPTKNDSATTQGPTPLIPIACPEGHVPRPTSSPVRRLTPTEYINSILSLFPNSSLPGLSLVIDTRIGGFLNNANGQSISPLHIENFEIASQTIASFVSGDVASWGPCDGSSDPVACIEDIATALASQAWRRPLHAEEATALVNFAQDELARSAFPQAVEQVVAAVLQSPQFLYRIELGDLSTSHNGLRSLTAHELASRLSYFLWQSPPDATLRAVADNGTLLQPEIFKQQAQRMLQDNRMKSTLQDFHRQWLRLDRLDSAPLSPNAFPEFTPEMRVALRRSFEKFVEDAVLNEGTWEALMTSPKGFVNATTAPAFGIPTSSSQFIETTLSTEERAGILTQPALLAATSHGTTHAPILRGVLMLNSILCQPPSAPPPGVNSNIPEPNPENLMTTRQRIEQTHGTGNCKTCHSVIDPMGFPFEHYDAIGRFRTKEFDLPIDASVDITQTFDLDGAIQDGVALAHKAFSSRQVKNCYVAHWARYALGTMEQSDDDMCTINSITDALDANQGDLNALFMALLQSDAFHKRSEEGLP